MRRPLLLAAAGLVLLVVVVARGESPVPSDVADVPEVDVPGLGSGISMPSFTSSRSPSDGGGSLVHVIVGSLIGLLLLVAVVLSVRVALRRRRLVRAGVREQGEDAGAAPDVVLEQAVVRARALLARPGGAPGDAVIEAWLALEDAAEGRRPHQTATEFTAGLPADTQALDQLRALYQRARFSTVPTTDDDITQARHALDRILVTLR